MNSDLANIYKQRRERARRAMVAQGLDAMLISSAPNRFYLSGFELHDGQPGESSGVIILTSSGGDWLATDDRFAETAASLWGKDRIYIYAGKRKRSLADLLPQCGYIIGFEAPAVSFDFLQTLCRDCHSLIELLPVWGLVEKLRVIKDPSEIAALERSFALNHDMLAWLHARLERGELTGINEMDLAWQIESYFRNGGASELAFKTIAATGPNGAAPHAMPGAEVITDNSPLLVDVGCRVDNYCSDQTRSWWNGHNPDAEFSKTLALVKEAQARAIEMIRPGVPCAEVYQAAHAVFEKAGVASAFTHGLGHGVGLETHEAPSLSPKSAAILQEGMVVTVEPGLYYPAWGGARWEHTVLVEADGARVL